MNRTTLQRIYIVFENSNNILLLTFYDLLTNTCSPIDVQLQYKVLGTGSDTDVSVSDGSLFLVSPLGTGTASTNDFVLTQFRPGGEIEYYYAATVPINTTPISLTYVSAETAPGNTPYQNIGGYSVCRYINSPTAASLGLGICLSTSVMNGKPDELVVVNLQPAQTTPLTRTTAVVNSAALQGAVNIACRFFTDTQIGCAVDTTDGSFTTLTLDQTADPDPAKYTFTINNVVGITSAVPVNTLAIAHSFE